MLTHTSASWMTGDHYRVCMDGESHISIQVSPNTAVGTSGSLGTAEGNTMTQMRALEFKISSDVPGTTRKVPVKLIYNI